jgi:hypothetical protein
LKNQRASVSEPTPLVRCISLVYLEEVQAMDSMVSCSGPAPNRYRLSSTEYVRRAEWMKLRAVVPDVETWEPSHVPVSSSPMEAPWKLR